jgi:hypothetical protein
VQCNTNDESAYYGGILVIYGSIVGDIINVGGTFAMDNSNDGVTVDIQGSYWQAAR